LAGLVETTTRVTGAFRTDFAPLRADDEIIGRMKATRTYDYTIDTSDR